MVDVGLILFFENSGNLTGMPPAHTNADTVPETRRLTAPEIFQAVQSRDAAVPAFPLRHDNP